MAGRGPAPKPDRIRRNRPKTIEQLDRDGTLELAQRPEPPAPPKGLLKRTREWWDAFWASKVAAAVAADTDVPALRRLARLYDERERADRAFRKSGRVVTGSKGQLVLHPLGKYLKQLDEEIRQLEDRFGLSPRARVGLQLQVSQARKSLEDLYRDLNDDPDAEPAPVIELSADDVEEADA